jgi:thiol:disulfide interchange protein DsbD
VPLQSPWPARYGVAKSGDPTLIVEAKGLKADTIRDVYFFPADWGPVASMAKQTASIGAEGIRIPLKRGDAKAALPADLSGTLVLTEKTADGEARQAFDVTAKLDPPSCRPRRWPRRAASSCRWSKPCCSPCWAA